MILTIQEARDTLRIDNEFNDDIIIPLVEAIPTYLESATGKTWVDENGVTSEPLAKTLARFLLIQWYNADQANISRLKVTIDTLIVSLTAIASNEKVNG